MLQGDPEHYMGFIFPPSPTDIEPLPGSFYMKGHPGGPTMLDVVYILIGAAFVGVCVLYAYACDYL